MKRSFYFVFAVCMSLMLIAWAAFTQNNNPCPSEKAYQFNIIGVPKSKNPDMTGTNGHRLFVNLTGNSKINMTGDTDPETEGLQCGNNFQVLDANATGTSEGLVLVPCENVNAESEDPGVCFDVWATALGGPGQADVDVVCTFDDTVVDTNIDDGDCQMDTIDFSLVRNSGKPVQQPITNYLRASGCFDENGDGECDQGEKTFSNIWIFNLDALEGYFWDYDNQGLRLAQIRFCDSDSCGEFGEQGPVCGDGILDEATEQCDDDNTVDGDGCSSTCQIEVIG